jgi:hypothetical protein
MHRLILGLGPGDPDVDHANHDKLDNRRRNLRLATKTQNQANTRKRHTGSSKYKGAHWDRGYQRWHSMVCIQGKRISLGYFASEIDAARAYDAAAAHFFSAFACPNFPDEIPAPYVPRPLPSSTSRGVRCYLAYRGSNKWRTQIRHGGELHFVGEFLTEREADAALQTYKREHNL